MADSSVCILRSLVAQVLQRNPDVITYVHDEYVMSHLTASLTALRELLPKILASAGSSWIIVDGIDECDPREQKSIIEDVVQLLSIDASSHICKILISSRDVPTVSRNSRKRAKAAISMSLNDEHQSADYSIQSFIQAKLSDLQNELDDLDPDGAVWHDIRRMLTDKANGKIVAVPLPSKL